jgi:hypothetical protein
MKPISRIDRFSTPDLLNLDTVRSQKTSQREKSETSLSSRLGKTGVESKHFDVVKRMKKLIEAHDEGKMDGYLAK